MEPHARAGGGAVGPRPLDDDPRPLLRVDGARRGGLRHLARGSCSTAEARALNALGLDLAGRSDVERSLPILREGHRIALEIGEPQAIFLSGVGSPLGARRGRRATRTLSLALHPEQLHALGADPAWRPAGVQGGTSAVRAGPLGRGAAAAGRDDRVRPELLRDALPEPGAPRSIAGFDAVRRDFQDDEALGERVVGPDPDLAHWRAELALVTGHPRAARRLARKHWTASSSPSSTRTHRSPPVTGLRAEADEADAARRRQRRLSRGRRRAPRRRAPRRDAPPDAAARAPRGRSRPTSRRPRRSLHEPGAT